MSLSLFDPFFDSTMTNWPSSSKQLMQGTKSFNPAIDIRETDKNLIVHCDLPGVKKENINVELDNGVLTISGSKSEDTKEEHENFYRRERSYGSFQRSMNVPKTITEDQIKANFTNGVLEVCLPKPEKSKTQAKNRITVN